MKSILQYLPEILILLLTMGVGAAGHKVFSDREIAALTAAAAKSEAAWSARALAAERQVREFERQAQENSDAAQAKNTQQQGIISDLTHRLESLGRDVGRVRLDRDRLHDDLTAFARGAVARDTYSACISRAERLARLVETGAASSQQLRDSAEELRSVAIGSAEAAQRRGAKLEACLQAWPGKARQGGG